MQGNVFQTSISLIRKFDGLDKSVKDLKRENSEIKKQNEELCGRVDELTEKLTTMESKLGECAKQQDMTDLKSRRKNLKFHGIDYDANETEEQTEEKVREYISATLNRDESEFQFERVFRLKAKTSRPVFVEFSSSKQRDIILKAFREVRKSASEENPVAGRVSEDLPVRIANARTNLYPFFQQCLTEGKVAYFKLDKLHVDGVEYEYDTVTKQPVKS